MSGLFDKLASVRERIAGAARRSGRTPEAVDLMAVTKYAPDSALRDLLAAGTVRHVGENRVQDAERKLSALSAKRSALELHFIGHLQANKARKAVALFDWVDSLDSLDLAERLEREAAALGRTLKVLVQVQPVPNPRQSGLSPETLGDFITRIRAFPHLEVRGVMAIAPVTDPVEAVRPHFRRTKALFEAYFPSPAPGGPRPHLSMGMSRDFEVAVEEGATLVRIGSLLFSESS